jgi:hypothetical protein
MTEQTPEAPNAYAQAKDAALAHGVLILDYVTAQMLLTRYPSMTPEAANRTLDALALHSTDWESCVDQGLADDLIRAAAARADVAIGPSSTASGNHPPGSHAFVLARPFHDDWSTFDGSIIPQGRDEFRPCMLIGAGNSKRIKVIGSAWYYDPTLFEMRSAMLHLPTAPHVLPGLAQQAA